VTGPVGDLNPWLVHHDPLIAYQRAGRMAM
jgi:hypothetical protein